MKSVKIIAFIAVSIILFSCGKNGEITDWSGPGNPSPPVKNETPAIPPDISPPECPCCPPADCSDDSNDAPDTPLYSPPDETEEPAAGGGDEKDPPPDPPSPNPPEYQRICLFLDDPSSHWWLIHQLTGGLLSYAKLKTAEYNTEVVENGIKFHFGMISSPGGEVDLELDYFIGKPKDTGARIVYHPDNFTLKYHGLFYIDPIFTHVRIDGEVECTGRSSYYPDSGTWYRTHTCKITGGTAGSMVFNFMDEDHSIGSGEFKRHFEGSESLPENFSFTSGHINIDGLDYNLDRDMPDAVWECLNP